MKRRPFGLTGPALMLLLVAGCGNGSDVVKLDVGLEVAAEAGADIGGDVAAADSQAEMDAVAGCLHHSECRDEIGDVGHCRRVLCQYGECVIEELPEGWPCEDGQTCTTPDTCREGVCIPGPDRCMCREDWDCAKYDEFFCGPFYRCLMKTDEVGICVLDPAFKIECDGTYDTHCLKNSCNPGTGQCQPTPAEDQTGCNDSDACTLGDHCEAGECGPEIPRNCDDFDPCTADTCDPATGCMHEPLTGPDCTLGKCFDGECKCVPDCGDRECGPHNCAGVCGVCVPEMETCNQDGYCLGSMVTVDGGQYPVGTTHDGGPHDDCAFLGLDSDAHECEDDLEYQIVQVEPFHIDAFEVANGQFLTFLQAIGSLNGKDNDGVLLFSSFPAGKFDKHSFYPGIEVGTDGAPQLGASCFGHNAHSCGAESSSWSVFPTPPSPDCTSFPAVATHEGARRYCQWAGKRLCTDLEYEAACNGPEGLIWPWGNELEARHAFYARWSISESTVLACDKLAAQDMAEIEAVAYMATFWVGNLPVGSYPLGVSPSGTWDMVGNASEWVADGYEKELYGEVLDYAWVRGGPRHFKQFHRRCSSRRAAQAGETVYLDAANFNGFRCCSDAP